MFIGISPLTKTLFRLYLSVLMCDLVFHGDRVPGHVDAFDRSKWSEGLSDGVLPQLVVDGADVNATHDGQSSLSLSRYLNKEEHLQH